MGNGELSMGKRVFLEIWDAPSQFGKNREFCPEPRLSLPLTINN